MSIDRVVFALYSARVLLSAAVPLLSVLCMKQNLLSQYLYPEKFGNDIDRIVFPLYSARVSCNAAVALLSVRCMKKKLV